MRVLLLFLFFRYVQSAYFLSSSLAEWDFLKAHNVGEKLVPQQINLNSIARQEWAGLKSRCPALPSSPSIRILFDYFYENTTVLAYASQTLHLSSTGVWVSKVYEAMKNNDSSSIGYGYDMMIGVNPYPPNGWFVDQNCSCENISYRFDLRSVIRHELLHGLILASSIRKENNEWRAGLNFQNDPNRCFPRLYDTKIRTANNVSVVQGCNVSDVTGEQLFINGIPLYNPTTYRPGSSFSHHNMYKNLMYFSMPARTCLDVGYYEMKLLEAMDIVCNISYTECHSNAVKKTVTSLFVLVFITLLLLF